MSSTRWRSVMRSGLVLFVARILVAMAFALPVTAALSNRMARFGDDAAFFDRGGLLALELLDASRGLLPRAVVLGPIVMALLSVLSLAPLALAIARLSPVASSGLVSSARAAIRAFPGLLLLLGVMSLLEAILALVALLGSHMVAARTVTGNDLDTALTTRAIELVSLAPLLGVALVHDVARSVLVGRRLGFYDATARALAVVRARPFALAAGYVSRAFGALILLGLAVTLTLALGMRSRGALLTCASAEMVALFGAATLRASWLARALSIEASVPFPRTPSDDDSRDDDVANLGAPALSSGPSETRSPGSSVGRAED